MGRDYDLLKETTLADYLNDSDLKPFFDVIYDSAQNSFKQIDYLRYIYSVEEVDARYLPRMADALGFLFITEDSSPDNIEYLRVFTKYYMEIRKQRGTMDSIKRMIRLINVKEEDICNGSFSDYTSVDIENPEPGFLRVIYNHINSNDLEFAYNLLKKVVPAGHRYEVVSGAITYPLP